MSMMTYKYGMTNRVSGAMHLNAKQNNVAWSPQIKRFVTKTNVHIRWLDKKILAIVYNNSDSWPTYPL